ncbi:TonB-dependent siderophore myxochelin receptor MxcH [Sorangium sp. So ce426]|uniref:TonB-dependent siderophore myxochelin receptor MxcH n=1 Tax=Sorangium sp. So ce426 TaxID=3133312 RepID=UPI003F5B93AA
MAVPAVVLALQDASAQEPPPPAPEAPAAEAAPSRPEVEMPRLLELVPAEYPIEAKTAGLERVVPLHLTIDSEGAVIKAEVIEPQGYGFDEAAQGAALRFRFEPARRAGRPVAAKIRYDYAFRLEPATEAPEPAPPSGASNVPEGTPPGGPAATEHKAGSPPPQAGGPPLRPIEVQVQGETKADQLRRSAEAVHVIETKDARRQSADLGEVLSRSQGVGVRRGGGLGTRARFSLNGLTDDQVRFFLDGVPLELAGYGLGLENVPVNLIERVEIYRGVVPIRFGADALGGAVNLVTDQGYRGTRAAASYQLGSFGTHRLTASGRHLFEPTGVFASASAFFDATKNNYLVDVTAADELGRPYPARVRRFHDDYRAYGGNLELGVIDRPWAKRLLLRLFVADHDKELQNNPVMEVPYGEVTSGELAQGGTLRYEKPNLFVRGLRLALLGGYTRRTIDFVDRSPWRVDWFGRRVARLDSSQPLAEIGDATDATYLEHRVHGRLEVSYSLPYRQELHVAVSPGFSTRDGRNRLHTSSAVRDPLSVERELFTVVGGIDHKLTALDGRIENVLFAKDYLYRASGERTSPGGAITPVERATHTQGFGDALRFRALDWLWTKASYEYATRLPRPDEVFGSGTAIVPNLALEPETSHNANIGVMIDAKDTAAGAFRGELNGFLRGTQQLIALQPVNTNLSKYMNVYTARSLGVEAAAGWTSPGDYLWLDGNMTWVEFRNTSDEGEFSEFEGDRIPNRPWLFANASLRLQFSGVNAVNDELSLTWNTRYVHDFFRGWESAGFRKDKQIIDSQTIHSIALTYLVRSVVQVSSSMELQNLTDARAYDFFGAQKPGRALFFKGTVEY